MELRRSRTGRVVTAMSLFPAEAIVHGRHAVTRSTISACTSRTTRPVVRVFLPDAARP